MPYKDAFDPRAREARRKHYYKNKEAYIARSLANKRKCIAYIRVCKDRPCLDCGIKYPYYVMDFDHREGVDKLNNISLMITYGIKKIQEEIDKCDVVCSNCHRERTYMRMSRSGSSVSKTVGSGSVT